ncbi:hypothetical protein ADICYQ_3191 [Cyclobacterium qasimii M12-11B]|uniref:Uncharacterized protein n=1 Tax=Cyclobacterium qasimii M12-11B TaxID=641524 RepID=S7VC21_9BACT|nr:hypothetical protein ADICYQ_3191 [Cyclobacterium qasimii M12-11B]
MFRPFWVAGRINYYNRLFLWEIEMYSENFIFLMALILSV